MMNSILNMVIAVLGTLLIQNIVFYSGYGVSEMLRLAMRPKYFVFMSGMVIYFSVALSMVSYFIERKSTFLSRYDKIIVRGVEYALILLVLYIITVLVMKYVFRAEQQKIKRTSIAAFNSLVLAVPLLNDESRFSFSASIGNAIGCALAFVVASVLVSTALVSIDNESMPKAFKGLPALFIFVGILSLAFMGFSS